tara:strand:+ start:184 stop:432 length:249 start_codon:yes stop_codon:yes gene_type:complete
MDIIIKNASIASGGVLVTGVGASMLIPVAMTTFGTVISGIGTIHMAGGVAATLQSTAAACTLSNSILVGACSIPITYIRSKL